MHLLWQQALSKIADDSQRKKIKNARKCTKTKAHSFYRYKASLFLPSASLSHGQLWHCFTGWDSYGPFGFVFKKKKFPPYFILLFVWEHLKEMEALNDWRLCIQAAILKDCMEAQPICWVAACFRRCPGEGMPQDWAGLRTPKWGTAQILVGPHVTIKTGGFFVPCGARPGRKGFSSANQKKWKNFFI